MSSRSSIAVMPPFTVADPDDVTAIAYNSHPMLTRPTLPGLFITATDTGVGKTMITAAIAAVLRRRGKRVAVSKPIATGCVHRREGLVSEDAEFLAHHSDT